MEIEDAEVPAVLFQDPVILIEWATAYLAENAHRAERLRAAGAPHPLPPGTKVEVAWADALTACIRVVSGPDEGRTGHVMSMCVGYHERARAADAAATAVSKPAGR